MPRHQDSIDAGVALGSVDAGAVLVEVQVDRDRAACTLEQVGVGGEAVLRCWGGRGEKGKEGE